MSQQQTALQFDRNRFQELMRTAEESIREAMDLVPNPPRMQTRPKPEVVIITTDKLLSILSRPDPTPILCEGRVIVDLGFSHPLRERLLGLLNTEITPAGEQ